MLKHKALAKREEFMTLMSLYLEGTFYTNLAIKYLMTCFYTTGIGTECIMTIPLSAIHIKEIFYANQ